MFFFFINLYFCLILFYSFNFVTLFDDDSYYTFILIKLNIIYSVFFSKRINLLFLSLLQSLHLLYYYIITNDKKRRNEFTFPIQICFILLFYYLQLIVVYIVLLLGSQKLRFFKSWSLNIGR